MGIIVQGFTEFKSVSKAPSGADVTPLNFVYNLFVAPTYRCPLINHSNIVAVKDLNGKLNSVPACAFSMKILQQLGRDCSRYVFV